MALKKEWPAIRAEWLWEWQKRGTVNTSPLFGTHVLFTVCNSRPFKKWWRVENGEPVSYKTRYWLAEGILLVPRWDPLEIHFSPKKDKRVKELSQRELGQRGMYRLEDGEVALLIYQHVEDVLHFQRQQWHIRLETYAAELAEIEDALSELEKIAVESTRKVDRDLKTASLITQYQRRRQEIHEVLFSIRDREKAAQWLLYSLKRELALAKEGMQGALRSEPLQKLRQGEWTSLKGVQAYLVNIYEQLGGLRIQPTVYNVNWAQEALLSALGALAVRDPQAFSRKAWMAVRHLSQAEKKLIQPKGGVGCGG